MKVPAKVHVQATTVQTPCYIYDLDRLRRRIKMVQALPIEQLRVFFATMANDHPVVLEVVRDAGAGVFVNSPRHLRLALEIGFDPARIIYAASNMTDSEIRLCLDKGVHVILESIGQVEAFGRAGGKRCSVRVYVGSIQSGGQFGIDPEYRFGILEDDIPDVLACAARYDTRIVGIHCYFGTDIMECNVLVSGLKALCRAATLMPDLELVDAGGGFGVPDVLGAPEFDLASYGDAAGVAMEELRQSLGRRVQFFIEPGRYLAADCGFFVVDVIDEKRRADRTFVGTNASATIFPRPLLYPDVAIHHCEPLNGGNRPHDHLPAFICGNSTYSRDFLGKSVPLPRLRPGERLVFHNAGAYCRSMMTDFLGKDRPAEFFVNEKVRSNEQSPLLMK